jgi:dTDP-4-dehydrorhamnose 3,5-epimerase
MMISGVVITPLKHIYVPNGDVLHAIKSNDTGYFGFGEAYFSKIVGGTVKAWKKHKEMVLNIIVPVGVIRFVLFDDRAESSTYGEYQEITLSEENYCRLTVPNMVWLGFQGVSQGESLLLNVASIPHEKEEVERKDVDKIKFNWGSF